MVDEDIDRNQTTFLTMHESLIDDFFLQLSSLNLHTSGVRTPVVYGGPSQIRAQCPVS